MNNFARQQNFPAICASDFLENLDMDDAISKTLNIAYSASSIILHFRKLIQKFWV
jgi:hypothetical protein